MIVVGDRIRGGVVGDGVEAARLRQPGRVVGIHGIPRDVLPEVVVVVVLCQQRAAERIRYVAVRRVVVEPDVAPGQVLAPALAGAGIDDVRPLPGVLVEDVLVAASEVVALAATQVRPLVVVGRDPEVPAVECLAVRHAEAAFLAARFRRRRNEAVYCSAGVLARDDVDDARHRIRAVDRRGAVLQDLDALDRRQRQHVEVERGGAALDACGACPAAVQ